MNHSPQARSSRLRAFTMVEMLVVIGVVLVLIAISVAGFAQIGKHSKAQHTKVALESVRAMMDEFRTSAGKQNFASFREAWDDGGGYITPTGNYDDLSVSDITLSVPTAPGGNIRKNVQTSWQLYSDQVLSVLLQSPNNKAILDKLPAEQVRRVEFPVNSGAFFTEILDGYGKPLRFVPTGGVSAVTTDARTGNLLLQSDGSAHLLSITSDRAPNPTMFWISPGPDRNYLTVDDNHYSSTP